MTEQEAWMLACVIQASEEQHGYVVLNVDTVAIDMGIWFLVVQQHYGHDVTFIHSPQDWYRLILPSYTAMPTLRKLR